MERHREIREGGEQHSPEAGAGTDKEQQETGDSHSPEGAK